jgi:hypothetical protein
MMTRIRMILLLGFVVALGFLLAGNAYAGEYTIHNCPASLQPNFDAGPWQSFGGPLPSAGGFQATCTPGSTLGTAIGWYGGEQSLNINYGVALQSPDQGITIREVRLVWSVAHQSSGSDTFAQVSSDTGVELVASTPYTASASSPTQVSFPTGTHVVRVYSYCSYDDSSNCYFPTSTTPIMKLEGIDTTLEDSNPPTATADGGSLAGSVVSGEATMQFTATDEGSGVREAQLLVDGRPLVTNSYATQCSYTTFAACPQSEADSMTWDTATVANGEHQIALRVTDASGNTQTVDSHTVLVSNATTKTGTTTMSEGPPTPPCVAAPDTQSAITLVAKHDTIATAYRKRAHLRGTLTGPGRKPISDATVEVLARPVTTGAVYAPLGHVRTGASGQFNLTLPPGTSRTVCLRYQQQPGGLYTAALNVTQQVQAGVTLAVNPKDVESNGTIILTGSVLGGYISSAGKVVELQVLYLGSWRVFQTVRTTADGQFTSFYSFLGGLGTFAFRARVRGENDYPYALGYSNPVRVRAG